MKQLAKKVMRGLGFEITRLRNTGAVGVHGTKTKKLSFYETKTGNYYLPTDAPMDEIAHAIKNDLIFDEEVYRVAKKYIQPGTIALDVGSNFGQMAILMSSLVGEKGIVHAFEADDWVFEILTKNIKANSSNIEAHFGAVHDKNNETLYFPEQDFVKYGTYGSYGIDYANHKGRPVESIKIDDINFELPISFMKIDIEGGEFFALKGAINTIKKYKMPILFEYVGHYEDSQGICFQDCVDFVSDINYRFEKVVGCNYLVISKDDASSSI